MTKFVLGETLSKCNFSQQSYQKPIRKKKISSFLGTRFKKDIYYESTQNKLHGKCDC